MKKFFFLAAIAALVSVSCAKDNTIVFDPFAGEVNAPKSVYDIELQFDASDDIQVTTVYFFDEDGVGVYEKTFAIPENQAEISKATIDSDTRPAYLYTPGLQNADENGNLRIPETSVETKAAGGQPVLLVIR